MVARGISGKGQFWQLWDTHLFVRAVTEDILRLLDHLRIPRAHFVGISLGTILIRHLAELCPERVKSMVLGGAGGPRPLQPARDHRKLRPCLQCRAAGAL
jgi:pimeloyl-ACP methyl ester carboxylesterase